VIGFGILLGVVIVMNSNACVRVWNRPHNNMVNVISSNARKQLHMHISTSASSWAISLMYSQAMPDQIRITKCNATIFCVRETFAFMPIQAYFVMRFLGCMFAVLAPPPKGYTKNNCRNIHYCGGDSSLRFNINGRVSYRTLGKGEFPPPPPKDHGLES